MSEEILDDLGFPAPDHSLGVGSGIARRADRARSLAAFERILLEERPALVVVAGDVNSTLACALAAAKLGIPVAHVESGLRSGDWSMPEEINRVLTDRLSDLLLTHSPEAEENLAREGIDAEPRPLRRQHDDRLAAPLRAPRRASARPGPRTASTRARVRARHAAPPVERRRARRASAGIVDGLLRARASGAPIVFPIHPRTRARLDAGGELERLEAAGVRCIEPVGYLDFLSLQAGAGAIVTDSGGVQEEAVGARRPLLHAARRTPSGRSRSRTGPTCCSATTRRALASRCPPPGAADAVRHPALGRPRRRARRPTALRRRLRRRMRREPRPRVSPRGRDGRAGLRDRRARHGPRRVARCERADRAPAASPSTWRSTRRSS